MASEDTACRHTAPRAKRSAPPGSYLPVQWSAPIGRSRHNEAALDCLVGPPLLAGDGNGLRAEPRCWGAHTTISVSGDLQSLGHRTHA